MSATKTYGLIGCPVKHSLSALMHNAAFKHCGIDAQYRLFEVKEKDLEGFLLGYITLEDTNKETFFAGDIAGFNITIPHKVRAKTILEEKILPRQTNLAQEDMYYVSLSGAVNTVKRAGGEIRYWNTDAAGFLRALNEDLKLDSFKNKSALLIGCGGAGRAIVAALSWKNVDTKKIFIYDNRKEGVASAQEHFFSFPQMNGKWEFISYSQITEVISQCQLLVNASPIGMDEQDPSVIDKDLIHGNLSVYDVVYNRKTRLLLDAADKGVAAAGGLGMFLYQGAAAFELWTEAAAPLEVMRGELQRALNMR
ncbi:MAG: shikimate dehydrogenase [Candidatus Omnitrophota bacterium]